MQPPAPAIRKSIQLVFCLQLGLIGMGQIKVTGLLCENLSNPICIDALRPEFSWQLVSDKRNSMQSAYEIRVSDNAASLAKNKNIGWSSGKIPSDSSVHVIYKGLALRSATKYFWQVRVWDNSGNTSPWSESASWQMGLLTANDWKAKWIEPGFVEDSVNRPSPLFRKEFKATKKIQSAIA